MRCYALILVAVLSAACDHAGDTLSPLRGATPKTSLALTVDGADLVTFFGPERFVRVRGGPATETRVISTKGFTTPFLLRVRNGDPDGKHRVSSATVRVDGVEIFSPNDFDQQFAGGEREIHPGSTVTLDVQLAAAPGGVLTIELLGKRAATRFCPTDFGDGVSHRFFFAAIAATEPGGTIVVCDGTHDINGVTINRPITIMPEHSGMVTITNRLNAIPFIVSAVPVGTVRITGLKFDISAVTGVAAFDVYDKVIVENSSFRFVGTVRTSIAPSAVQVSASFGPSPEAMVTARGNSVTGMENGFVALGGRLDLADNTIDRSASHSIWYFPRTRGTIEGNRITSCGVNGCIRATPTSTGFVEVLNNHLVNDIARNTGRGIDFQGRGAVRGNVIVGVGGSGVVHPLGSGSFAFRAGAISVSGSTGFAPVIEHNEITNAFFGIEFFGIPAGVIGRHNRINRVAAGFAIAPSGTNGNGAVLERNDISEYFHAISGPAATIGYSFKCNWWGHPDGPLFGGLGPPSVPEALWTPFSSEPIANRPDVECVPTSTP